MYVSAAGKRMFSEGEESIYGGSITEEDCDER